jgi:hypothetical protein
MTVATSSRRHTPRTKGTGAIGCMCCPDTARMPRLAALLPDRIRAACRRSSSLVSPPEQQSCGPISPLERGLNRLTDTLCDAACVDKVELSYLQTEDYGQPWQGA